MLPSLHSLIYLTLFGICWHLPFIVSTNLRRNLSHIAQMKGSTCCVDDCSSWDWKYTSLHTIPPNVCAKWECPPLFLNQKLLTRISTKEFHGKTALTHWCLNDTCWKVRGIRKNAVYMTGKVNKSLRNIGGWWVFLVNKCMLKLRCKIHTKEFSCLCVTLLKTRDQCYK